MVRRAAPAPAPPAVPRAPGSRPWTFLLPAAALLALVFVAHGPSLTAGFIWDDDVYVTENPHLRDAAGLFAMWFRIGATKQYDPLVFTAFWLEHRLWGLDPRGYHAVNVALHGLCVLLLWALLRRLAVPGAWLAAALFATHPVFVQSVAWVSELKNVQSGLFALLCLLAWVRSRRLDQSEEPQARPEGRFYVLSLLLFAAAVLSKPSVVALPLVLLLLVFWKRGSVSRSDALRVVPMLAGSLALGLVAIHVEQVYGGSVGAEWSLTLLERALVSARALWFYVGKLLWPVPLMSNYPRWEIDARTVVSYVPLLAGAAAIAALWLGRQRIGRGPITAVAAFVVLVAPLTGLFDVAHHLYSFVADHFQYHAAPALLALAAASATGLAARLPGRSGRVGFHAACGLVLVVLALLSRQHTGAFRSEKARCLDTLAKNPTAWVAMNNLGVVLAGEGKHAEAARWYREALRVRPVYPEARSNLASALLSLGDVPGAVGELEMSLAVWPSNANARNNLGTAREAAGDLPAALREYREALRIDPAHAEAHQNLARLLARTGAAEEALLHHREAVRVRPGWAEAWRDLGTTLAASGRLPEAIEAFEEALRLRPDDASASDGLGKALASEGRLADAIARFEEALRADPRHAEAHNDLGTALAARGDLAGATRHFEEAVRLRPEDAAARRNLGTAALSRGDAVEAERQLREAVRLAPDDARAFELLGIVLGRTGRLPEAVHAFERAVALAPADEGARRNLEEARRLAGRRVPSR